MFVGVEKTVDIGMQIGTRDGVGALITVSAAV